MSPISTRLADRLITASDTDTRHLLVSLSAELLRRNLLEAAGRCLAEENLLEASVVCGESHMHREACAVQLASATRANPFCQSTTLVIAQQDSLAAMQFLEYLILSPQVLDHLLLFPVYPAG